MNFTVSYGNIEIAVGLTALLLAYLVERIDTVTGVFLPHEVALSVLNGVICTVAVVYRRGGGAVPIEVNVISRVLVVAAGRGLEDVLGIVRVNLLPEREGALEFLYVCVVCLEIRSNGAASNGQIAVFEGAVDQTLIALVLLVDTGGFNAALFFLRIMTHYALLGVVG